MADETSKPGAAPPLLLAGHLALDFLNTQPLVSGELVDYFQGSEDVLNWFVLSGVDARRNTALLASRTLVETTRTLRATIRRLIERRKEGERADPSTLNGFLREAQSHLLLVWKVASEPALHRVRRTDTPEQLLAPVAEAAADLLVTGDFELIRRCEDAACVLWFLDQTKSHHRRWCSMETCGNRHKVAAYRKRRDSPRS